MKPRTSDSLSGSVPGASRAIMSLTPAARSRAESTSVPSMSNTIRRRVAAVLNERSLRQEAQARQARGGELGPRALLHVAQLEQDAAELVSQRLRVQPT